MNCVKFNAAATGFQCLLCVEISRCVLLSVSGTTVATLCHLPRPDQLGAGPVAKKNRGPCFIPTWQQVLLFEEKRES